MPEGMFRPHCSEAATNADREGGKRVYRKNAAAMSLTRRPKLMLDGLYLSSKLIDPESINCRKDTYSFSAVSH